MSEPDGDRAATADPPRADPATATMPFWRWVLETAALMALAWVIAQGIMTYVAQQYEIPSTSMEDTLQIGDHVLVNKLAYRFGDPKPGDVVVFISPEDSTIDWVKRVVAVAGQTVEVRDDVVYVDGKPLSEPYVNRRYRAHYDSEATLRIPEGTVYVMGDNRANSHDSRYVGPQPVSHILGRAEAVVWPVDRAGRL